MKLKTADEDTGLPMALEAAANTSAVGKATQVGKALAQCLADGHKGFDVANAVLETHEVGATLGQHHQAGSAEAAGAPVVDDDADLHAPAYGLHMGHQALLAGFGQVMGPQQDALRAQALGFLCVADGQGGAAAGASGCKRAPRPRRAVAIPGVRRRAWGQNAVRCRSRSTRTRAGRLAARF